MCSAPVSTWKYSDLKTLSFSTRLHDFFSCEMVRDNWNIHLLQQVLSGKDEDDLKYITALRALNAPNLYWHTAK